MYGEIRKHIDKRIGVMRSERSYHLEDWRDMSDFVHGSRGRYLLSKNQKMADRRNPELYNEEAKFACNTLASGMMAGITSPARPWFRLRLEDEDLMDYGPVQDWLTYVQRLMFRIFAKSNFYNQIHGLYKELGTFGQCPFVIAEDFNNVIHCETFTAGSYFIDINDKSQVDTLYRENQLTVRQLVYRFGLENVSPEVKQLWNRGDYGTAIDIVWAMEPNDKAKWKSPFSNELPVRSIWMEQKCMKQEAILRNSGFRMQPFMCPRWEIVAEDVYASSYPAIDCINSNKSLQVDELDLAVAHEKQHNPPLIGDSTLKNAEPDLIAGGITWDSGMTGRQGKPGLAPVYEVSPQTQGLMDNIARRESRIQRAFFADLFLMITEMDRRQITATEIAERKEEKMLMLGPVLERLNFELLDPIVERTYEIAHEKGLIPPPPQELIDVLGDNTMPDIEYISVLAQAQKAVATASIEATAAFAGNLAAIKPEAVDKLNVDEMIDEYAKAKGAPPKTIHTEDEVAATRQARAEQAAAQQQAESAMAAVAGAKQLSETSTDENTILGQLMNGVSTGAG